MPFGSEEVRSLRPKSWPQQNKAANEIVQTLTGRSRWRANAKFETSEASWSAVVIFQYTLVYSYIPLILFTPTCSYEHITKWIPISELYIANVSDSN